VVLEGDFCGDDNKKRGFNNFSRQIGSFKKGMDDEKTKKVKLIKLMAYVAVFLPVPFSFSFVLFL
jgi:hypothetical protein